MQEAENDDSATEGCGWTTVQTSDAGVVAILPIPLPAPPPGGAFEVYSAVSTGHASLRSTLSCSDGSAQQTWSVTIDVEGASPSAN